MFASIYETNHVDQYYTNLAVLQNMNISHELDFNNVRNLSYHDNTSTPGGASGNPGGDNVSPTLGPLGLILVIGCSTLGNLLVCLAVIWDRRLQNMTNYFLMSLAIADLLVSLLVMPLGMVVEMYGYFPLDPEFCIFWVTMDVLMCTASIWHMCTMSMDRYFTLKYPMRYGRNKTKMMVVIKIFFVWAVSITISSPIFIFGVKDTTTVYNEGLCVPTLADFVIYGSIFAFYIPLTIMLITYVLTIRILWKNQLLMRNIERSNFRPRKYENNKCVIRTMLSPPSDEGSRKVSIGNDNSDTDATMLAAMLSQSESLCPSRQEINQDDKKYDLLTPKTMSTQCVDQGKNDSDFLKPSSSQQNVMPLRTTNDGKRSLSESDAEDLEHKSVSLSCLQITVSPYQDFYSNPSIDLSGEMVADNTKSTNSNFLRVNSNLQVNKRDRGTLHAAASFSNVPHLNSSQNKPQRLSETVQFHSCGNLDKKDFKFVEWKQHYFQIQREMDQCLKDAEREKSTPLSSDEESGSAQHHSPTESRRGSYLRVRTSPNSGAVSDSGDSLEDLDSSSSNNSELLTINLRPKSFHMYKLNMPKETTKPLLQKCNGTKRMANGHCNDMKSLSVSVDKTNSYSQKRKSIKYFINRLNKSDGVKQILSKKATSNEKKASKVLGIIFAVFVILWTPFFTVNILSVTCSTCMANVTPQMMSVFLWMGYIASLANPIIYTMFNTAFRRTFIRILKCHLCRKGGIRMDSLVHMQSYAAAAASLNTDRRNTMTVTLKDDVR